MSSQVSAITLLGGGRLAPGCEHRASHNSPSSGEHHDRRQHDAGDMLQPARTRMRACRRCRAGVRRTA